MVNNRGQILYSQPSYIQSFPALYELGTWSAVFLGEKRHVTVCDWKGMLGARDLLDETIALKACLFFARCWTRLSVRAKCLLFIFSGHWTITRRVAGSDKPCTIILFDISQIYHRYMYASFTLARFL